jgi:hypothetical protein
LVPGRGEHLFAPLHRHSGRRPFPELPGPPLGRPSSQPTNRGLTSLDERLPSGSGRAATGFSGLVKVQITTPHDGVVERRSIKALVSADLPLPNPHTAMPKRQPSLRLATAGLCVELHHPLLIIGLIALTLVSLNIPSAPPGNWVPHGQHCDDGHSEIENLALGCVDTYRIHRMMAARVTTAR